MPKQVLIVDSGATKAEWVLIAGKQTRRMKTVGISPYFMDVPSIHQSLKAQLKTPFLNQGIDDLFFYGTGCASRENAAMVKKALRGIWTHSSIHVADDLLGATRALCGQDAGIACILGTGSSSAAYSGRSILTQRPGLGFALGDEGSGAYFGKKLIQYFLYDEFDQELKEKFYGRFGLDRAEILDSVYKKPAPSRYLASFTPFLSENRGHYMVENILEDGLQEFFTRHICRYRQASKVPIHFTGTVAYVFRDWVRLLCEANGLKLGQILQKPLPGLIRYHNL